MFLKSPLIVHTRSYPLIIVYNQWQIDSVVRWLPCIQQCSMFNPRVKFLTLLLVPLLLQHLPIPITFIRLWAQQWIKTKLLQIFTYFILIHTHSYSISYSCSHTDTYPTHNHSCLKNMPQIYASNLWSHCICVNMSGYN